MGVSCSHKGRVFVETINDISSNWTNTDYKVYVIS